MELDKYLTSLFPDPEEKSKWITSMKMAANAGYGHGKRPLIIWFGIGANGKTTLRKIVQEALGEKATLLHANVDRFTYKDATERNVIFSEGGGELTNESIRSLTENAMIHIFNAQTVEPFMVDFIQCSLIVIVNSMKNFSYPINDAIRINFNQDFYGELPYDRDLLIRQMKGLLLG